MKNKIIKISILIGLTLTGVSAEYLLTHKLGSSLIQSEQIKSKPADVLEDDYNYISTLIEKSDWTLCFDNLQHGNQASQFHANCDDKGPTVTIVTYNNKTFGAYSDVDWGEYKNTGNGFKSANSYIFDLTDNVEYTTTSNHVYVRDIYGPTFGGGFDLVLLYGGVDNYGYCNPNDYKNSSNQIMARETCGVVPANYRFYSHPEVKVYAVE